MLVLTAKRFRRFAQIPELPPAPTRALKAINTQIEQSGGKPIP
jgi:hypothetical protein